jgi:flagellar motor switch protein FliG
MRKKLTGAQKIAVLLAVAGPEASAHLLRQFEEDEQRRIEQAMLEVERMKLDDDSVQGVVEDFRKLVDHGVTALPNVEKRLADILSSIHGGEAAKRRIEEHRANLRDDHPFHRLRGVRPVDLAKVVRSEHPQVQALVLTHLDPDLAAAVLDQYPEAERPALVERMAAIEPPGPKLLRAVAQQIAERTRLLPREDGDAPAAFDPRIDAVAKVLLNAGPGNDAKILDKLSEAGPELPQKIRERMFQWSDLAVIDKKTMQRILADLDTRLLALGLKAGDEEVRSKVLASVSSRTAQMITEEKDLLGAVPLKEVLDAQGQILTVVRDLISKGDVKLARGKDAVYVA